MRMPRVAIVYDLASAPLLKRGVPRKRPSGAVAGRGKRLGFGGRFADQNIGAGTHAAADKHRLANGAQCFGQAFMSGPRGPRSSLAVNEQLALLSVGGMYLDLARVVRNIKQKPQIATGKEVSKNPARVVAEDFAVG